MNNLEIELETKQEESMNVGNTNNISSMIRNQESRNPEMYEETLQRLYNLWTTACRERDEAREQLQRSLVELSELKKLLNNFLLFEEQQKLQFPETAVEINHRLTNFCFSNDSLSQFSFTSPLDFISFPSPSPGISDSGVTTDSYIVKNSFQSSLNQASFVLQNRNDEFETIVLEILAKGKVLPEKGNLLQTVMEAGPLLESLLITGPVPKWRNPPVQVAVQKSEYGKNFRQSSDSWSVRKRVSDGSNFGSQLLHQPFPGKRSRFGSVP